MITHAAREETSFPESPGAAVLKGGRGSESLTYA